MLYVNAKISISNYSNKGVINMMIISATVPLGTDGVCQCLSGPPGGLDLVISKAPPPALAWPGAEGIAFFNRFFGPFFKTLLDSLLQRFWGQLGPLLGSFWG